MKEFRAPLLMNCIAQSTRNSPQTECKQCSVRDIALFKGVLQNDLKSTQSYRKNQLITPARSNIYQEGEKHDFIYTLFSGWGVLYKTVSNNGKRQILRFLLPGDLIGYHTNLNGTMSHSAGTITESVFCAFPRNQLKSMLTENPELALQLLDMGAQDLSLCQNHLMAAGRKTAMESIAFLLMELYYRIRSRQDGNNNLSSQLIDFPITQEDIGDAVGLTNVHVNRVIKKLMDKKLIECHKKQLLILDEKKLCKIAEFSPEMISSHSLI